MLAGPGTRGPSILHEMTSKSASRDPRDTPRFRITARVDLEGSRGLESLPGALFFSRSDVQNFKKTHFLPEKNRRRHSAEPQTRAGGRRQAGGGRRQAKKAAARPPAAPEAGGRREAKIRVFPKMPGEPLGGSGGPP